MKGAGSAFVDTCSEVGGGDYFSSTSGKSFWLFSILELKQALLPSQVSMGAAHPMYCSLHPRCSWVRENGVDLCKPSSRFASAPGFARCCCSWICHNTGQHRGCLGGSRASLWKDQRVRRHEEHASAAQLDFIALLWSQDCAVGVCFILLMAPGLFLKILLALASRRSQGSFLE